MFWLLLAGAAVLAVPAMVGAVRASDPGTLDRPTPLRWKWMALVTLSGSALLILAAVWLGPVD